MVFLKISSDIFVDPLGFFFVLLKKIFSNMLFNLHVFVVFPVFFL